MKIQTKLLIAFLIISIVPTLTVGLLSLFDANSVITSHIAAMEHMTGLQESLSEQLDRLKNILLITTGVTALVVVVMAIFIAKSIAKPIQKLTQVAEDISKGQFDSEIDPKILASKGEAGDLARAFDRTVASLKLAMMEKGGQEPQK